jgi:hypothetical protein
MRMANISHLVVLMLENRSFDHMLGWLQSPEYRIDRLDGTWFSLDSTGAKVPPTKDAAWCSDYAGHYSFHKLRADFLQKFYPEFQKEPTGGSKTTFRKQPKYDSVLYIAARFTDEGAGAGRVIPFYLQETLRGYQDYRFRAPALFEIQTRYERRCCRRRLPASR